MRFEPHPENITDTARPDVAGQIHGPPKRKASVAVASLVGLTVFGSVGLLRDLLPTLPRHQSIQGSGSPALAIAPERIAEPPNASRPVAPKILSGIVEAIPQNIYHASPYNDWPLFEIKVREGQRLKFARENGVWTGDRTALFIQFETPAEIETRNEEVEVAALDKVATVSDRDILRVELEKELEAAKIREQNARQQWERVERLHQSKVATLEDLQRARNSLALAVTQKEQAVSLLDKKVDLATTKVDLAEHRLRRAQAELQLADFKREMSWGRVPVARGQFEEVVVTKVRGVRGDVPTAASRKEPWVEVIDDRILNVRIQMPAARSHNFAVGQAITVDQDGRDYEGKVACVGAVADAETHLVPVLIEVQNADRQLKINTMVTIKIGPP